MSRDSHYCDVIVSKLSTIYGTSITTDSPRTEPAQLATGSLEEKIEALPRPSQEQRSASHNSAADITVVGETTEDTIKTLHLENHKLKKEWLSCSQELHRSQLRIAELQEVIRKFKQDKNEPRQDLNRGIDSQLFDEDYCRERLTRYEAISIRKIIPPDLTKDKATWAKSDHTRSHGRRK